MTLAVRKSLRFIHDDCEFYPHQVDGIRKLARMNSFILADEPGLGKSLQALTVFAIDVERGIASRALIICLATLKGNWLDEIAKHTSFRAMQLSGTPAQRANQLDEFQTGDYHILVMNYEQVPSHVDDLNALDFDVVIYDEAHAIKNPKSKRTKACHKLRAKRHALLTGTPLMNNVADLWSLLYRVDPFDFPNYWGFLNRYAVFGGFQNRQILGVKNERELKAALDTRMVRRRSAEVLKLPEKRIIQELVDLHPKQREVYRQIDEEMRVTTPLNPTPLDIENAMTRFQKLKQVCGTPSCIPGHEDNSIKLDRAEELVAELGSNGFHVVIFTQFTGVLEAFQQRLASMGAPTFVLRGSTPIDSRQQVVKDWAAHPRPAVLLCMLQVGGIGLTFTRARHAIFLDKDFTPAINGQAQDRLYRIGADLTQPVVIYEIICRKTIESRVERILKFKQKIFDAVVNDSDFKRKLYAALTEEDDD